MKSSSNAETSFLIWIGLCSVYFSWLSKWIDLDAELRSSKLQGDNSSVITFTENYLIFDFSLFKYNLDSLLDEKLGVWFLSKLCFLNLEIV